MTLPDADAGVGLRGPLTGDPLAARLFPPLPQMVRWGLDRTERLLARVGSPHKGLPVLHVGGTNGKGSVARIWASVLQEAGFRVGLYTSPPLISFRERILVDGRPLPDASLEELAGELRPDFVRVAPSPFEAITVLAFLAFRRFEVDLAVVEVGMGGRLDATNVVEPILTAVTNVSLEHRQMLGDTVEAIAREKAGILKAGVPAYTAAGHPGALAVLGEEAATLGVPLTRVLPGPAEVSMEGIRLRLRTRRWDLLQLRSPLLGAHQVKNLTLAVRALESLPPRFLPRRAAVERGVAAARVPGRMQLEEEGPRRWLLDVAHNPEGMRSLVAALGALPFPGPRVGVVGILKEKAWEEMLGELAGVLDRVLLTVGPSTPEERRWDPASVLTALQPEAVGAFEVHPELNAALERARALTEGGGTAVVTGSVYTVGDALVALDRIPLEALPLPEDPG